LIGDAGKLTGGKHPELVLLKSLFNLNDGHTTLVYLGDNVYPAGLPDAGHANYPEAKKILDDEIAAVQNTSAQTYFIPGNHDWKRGTPEGWAQLMNEVNYIQSLHLPNVHFVPAKGCPGPEEIALSGNVTLLVMDSQWWLHRYAKPGDVSDCECKSEDEVLASLKDLLYKNRNKLVLFATHHPFKSYGKHGGYFNIKQHIFPFTDINPNLWLPLPVAGSLYPIGRGLFGNSQDLHHPVYRKMITAVEEVLNNHPNCIRVSGHDHNLQLIEENDRHYIVSGGGSKSERVKKGKYASFVSPTTGFAVIELTNTGNVWVKFYSSSHAEQAMPLHVTKLLTFNPAQEKKEETASTIALPDSITAIAAPFYKAGAYKQWFLGSNYRKEWTQPLRVKVLDIGKEMGGLKPVQRGGGRQSRSLRLEDANGKQYVLRSIEKYPEKVLPPDLRETFAKDLIKDGISASYPYSSLSIPPLAEAAGIPHATPQLVYVPDDARLKQYRPDFANTLCLLEEREPEVERSYSTENVFEKLDDDHDNRVDQQAVLQARLLDMFIMDFDRHEDQWRWGIKKDGKREIYFPIPRDRDQAFFINNGFLPRFISRPWVAPQLQGFRKKAINIKRFNNTPRNFDRNFLNALNEDDWKKQAGVLISQMTDSVIERSIRSQPPEIYPISGSTIIETLKARRQFMMQEALQYYRFLAKEVDITGSDKRELFDINRMDNGIVQVKIYAISKDGDTGAIIYNRAFSRHDTREIRLYGMGGEDRFVLHGNASKTIKVRIVGGSGNDIFINEASHTGAVKTVIYDVTTEQNTFAGGDNNSMKLSPNATVNRLNRTAFKYDILAPLLSANYNLDDGVYLGISFKYTTHAFRKEPFSVQQRLTIAHSLATNAYNFKYALEAIDVFGKADMVVLADIKAPNNTINFFGYGNETVFDRSGGKKILYYRTRFALADVVLLSRFNIATNTTLSAGPFLQRFAMNIKDNKERLITLPLLNGLDSASLFKQKNYGGVQVSTIVDNRNNVIMPSRGINWQTTLRVSRGIGSWSENCTQLNSDLSLYFSFNTQANLVIATRFGGGINFGHYEFFQAQFLSGTENLRGYRKYRFAGDKMAFNNTELRIKLADFRTYLLPGNLGIVIFHDIGRVWVKGESSSRWHSGYGGGIWLSPLKRFVGTACYGYSRDGGLPFVSIGFQF
jgi:hypothetical protein